ncbi:DMT family transporter [bacterium]|nr:DMT family transporter [bacterium]
MIFLIGNIILISAFGLLLKHAGRRGQNLLAVGAVNYIFAALLSIFSVVGGRDFQVSTPTMIFGTMNGVTYVICFFLILYAMNARGIAVSMAIVRVSVVIPVLFSIVYWQEIPNRWQVIGIILACISLPLLSTRQRGNQQPGQTAKWLGLVIATLFLFSGGSQVAMKSFNELSPASEKSMYLLFLFGTTAAVSVWLLLWKRIVPSLGDIIYGVVIGSSNILGSGALIFALEKLPGMIVFPISASAGLLFTVVIAVSLLGEKLERRAIIGMVMTIMALVFINLKI